MKLGFTLSSFAILCGQLQLASANFDVMDIIDASYKKLMENGFFSRESHHESVFNSPQSCENGKVTIAGEDFPCKDVDFLSFLSMEDLEIPFPEHTSKGARSSDIWGWRGPSGREFTLLSLDNGMVVIDSSDPRNPCIIAKMPSRRPVDIWADIKVHDNTAYHVKDTNYFRAEGLTSEPESTAGYGLEVYDLLPFDQMNCHVDNYNPLLVWPTYVFNDHGRSHNLVVDTESGLLFTVGTEKCNGGFMILDVHTKRLRPEQVGCADADGYTHDGQCLIYDGPDPNFQGREICFGFNEDTLTIWDFTDLENLELISRTYYPNQAFTHQGWVTDDLTKVLLDDELEEMCNNGNPTNSRRCRETSTFLTGHKTTSTYVFDITDLSRPVYEGFFDHEDNAVDHNLYIWGNMHRKGWGGNPPVEFYPDPNYAYMNNYLAGLKIVDIHDKDYTKWFTAGYFDISPERDDFEFAGAWSGYMHPSGVYAISSIERGMFLLSPRMAFSAKFPPPPQDPQQEGLNPFAPKSSGPENKVLIGGWAAVLAISAFVLLAGLLAVKLRKENKLAAAEEEVEGQVEVQQQVL